MFPRSNIFYSADEIIAQRMSGATASSSAASANNFSHRRASDKQATSECEAAEFSTFTKSTPRLEAHSHYGIVAKPTVARSALTTTAARMSSLSLFLLFVAFVALGSSASKVSASPYIHNAQDPVHYAALSSPNSNNAAALYLRFRKDATMNQAHEYVEPFIRFRKSFSPTAADTKSVMKRPLRRALTSLPGYGMSFDVIDNEYRY